MQVDTQVETQQPMEIIEVSTSSNEPRNIEILSKISDIELLESDLKTIEGNNRLNDSVILAFMKSFKKVKNVFVTSQRFSLTTRRPSSSAAATTPTSSSCSTGTR